MIENLHHVIMAGGSGTRFWPVSRRDRPKQFLEMVGRGTMIRQTRERCERLGPPDRIHVSAGARHRELVMEALPGLGADRFIGEPVARNTAPAIGLCALRIFLSDPDALAVFCPADHIFTDLPDYTRAIERGVAAAASGDQLVTLGIRPSRPETGYGYIEAGEPTGMDGVLRVSRFIEKPEPALARELSTSGRHFWNSGVFIWRVASVLEAIERHHPVLAEGLTRIRDAARAAAGEGAMADPLNQPGVSQVVKDVFDDQPSISIDYAVMEKAPNVLVVPCDPGWSDVGSWDAIAEMESPDGEGNLLEGDVVAASSSGNLVRGGTRLIALAGVEDLIVVDTPDVLLICRRGESQKVREIVAALSKGKRSDLL